MSYPPKKPALRQGFTLIEILVVLAVTGVLAGILIPVISSARERAKVSVSTSNLRQIGVAMNLFANEHNNQFPAINDTSQGQYGQVWFMALSPYLIDMNREASEMTSSELTDVYRCPVWKEHWEETRPDAASSDWNQLGYGMSYRMVYENGWPFDPQGNGAQNFAAPRPRIKRPSETVMVGPARSWNLNFQRYNIPNLINPNQGIDYARRHGDFGVYLMADGSVKPLDATAEALLPYVAN